MPKALQKIRMKLQYEWKNIYRALSSSDTQDSGTVTRKQFDDILQNCSVFLSNEELKVLSDRFSISSSNGKSLLSYMKMSEELGLHSNSINIMRATHSKINRLKAESRQNAMTYQ